MLLFMAAVLVYMLIRNSDASVHSSCACLTWGLASHLKAPIGPSHGAWSAMPDALHLHGAKTAGPSLCHGMRPPSLRREDEPHHSCQTVTAQDLCSVFRYGHHLLLEPKEWCCQLSCNLICTKILRTGKRNSPTQRNIIIFSFFELKGRNLNTIIFDMSDLAWHGFCFWLDLIC